MVSAAAWNGRIAIALLSKVADNATLESSHHIAVVQYASGF